MGAHAHAAERIHPAIRAGVRIIVYGSSLDDESVELLKQSGRRTFYVPTLVIAESDLESAPESEMERTEAQSLSSVNGERLDRRRNLLANVHSTRPPA